MKRIILITALLLPLSSFGAKKFNVKKAIEEHLKVSQVRADCTIGMRNGGIHPTASFVFCDCVTQTIYKAYGASVVADPRSLPKGTLDDLQKRCGETVDTLMKKVGEQSSPDKVK